MSDAHHDSARRKVSKIHGEFFRCRSGSEFITLDNLDGWTKAHPEQRGRVSCTYERAAEQMRRGKVYRGETRCCLLDFLFPLPGERPGFLRSCPFLTLDRYPVTKQYTVHRRSMDSAKAITGRRQ